MTEHSTYGTRDHDWWAEVPAAALEAAGAWLDRMKAGDPDAVALARKLDVDEGVNPAVVVSRMWRALLLDTVDIEPLRAHEAVFGQPMAGHVHAIWEAYEDDPGYGPIVGLEDRARERLEAGLASPSDQAYLLRQAAAT